MVYFNRIESGSKGCCKGQVGGCEIKFKIKIKMNRGCRLQAGDWEVKRQEAMGCARLFATYEKLPTAHDH